MKTEFGKKINIFLLCVLLSGTLFTVACNKNQNRPQNPYAQENNFAVNVTDGEDALEFTPVDFTPKIGLVFYVAAFVDPANYSYLGNALARQGYKVVIPKLDNNFAYNDYNPNIPALLKYPDIKFFIGGHDMGGGAAVRHAMDYAANGYNVAGLILYAPTDFKKQKFENGQLVFDEENNPVWDHFSVAHLNIDTLLLEVDDALRTENLKTEARQHINANATTLTTLANSSSLAFSTINPTSVTDKNAVAQRADTVKRTLDFALRIMEKNKLI